MIDYASWAEGLLGAAAGGDPDAAGLADIADRCARGLQVDSGELIRLLDYIKWVESKNAV